MWLVMQGRVTRSVSSFLRGICFVEVTTPHKCRVWAEIKSVIHMKAFFYIWCVLAIVALIASFYNPGHIWFSFVPSFAMACASYPETKKDQED